MVLTKLLNSTHENILQGDVLNGVRTLMVALYEQRLSLPERAWKDLVSVCRQHPICSVLHEDPLTQRSFTKPRGYAGDAVMLDMIYGSPHKNDPSELGRSIHHSAGLFDYLTTPVAGALLSRMFEMLKPGGKFLVANFANTCTEIGYMEAFMDWWLIYRDEAQMKTLVEVLDDSVTNNVQIFADPWKTIAYAVGERRQTEEPRSMPQARTAD